MLPCLVCSRLCSGFAALRPLHPRSSGSVVCYDVQDHTPPTMSQFVEFLNVAAAAAARGRLLAVHCRGGKGRTGSVCCAWLLFTQECGDADDALAFFALERTELGLGKKKLQGVDTPSQRRYVHQVAALLQSQGAYYPAGRAQQGFLSVRVSSGDVSSVAAVAAAAADSGGGACGGVAAAAEELGRKSGGACSGASVVVPPAVQLPARPVLSLSRLELRSWFALPPNGPIVCAVHTELPSRCGPCFVTRWSEPLHIEPGVVPPDLLAFQLQGGEGVAGDVRISVFSLPKLLEARQDRVKHNETPTLPFDRAPDGPWGPHGTRKGAGYLEHGASSGGRGGGGGGGGGEGRGGRGGGGGASGEARHAPSASQERRDSRRIIAGEEPGCLFYFLFHSGFVGASEEIGVPVPMMDRAFKNKKGKYKWEGKCVLRFALRQGQGDVQRPGAAIAASSPQPQPPQQMLHAAKSEAAVVTLTVRDPSSALDGLPTSAARSEAV